MVEKETKEIADVIYEWPHRSFSTAAACADVSPQPAAEPAGLQLDGALQLQQVHQAQPPQEGAELQEPEVRPPALPTWIQNPKCKG